MSAQAERRWRGIRRYRVTLVLVALTVLAPAVLHFAFGVREHPLLALLGGSADQVFRHGHWYSPLTAVFIGGTVFGIVLSVLGIVLLMGTAERLLGSGRALLAYVVTGTIALTCGILAQWLLNGTGERWGRHVFGTAALESLVPVVGALMAASAAAGPLWRRRIRVLGMATLIAFVLFSGQLDDVNRLIAGAAGLILGPMLLGRGPRLQFVRSSVYESRTILAVIVAIVALGPLITLASPRRLGPLSPLGELFGPAVGETGAALPSRLDGPGPVLLSLLPLLVLLLCARGLQRGRRAALWIAASVNVLLAGLAAFYYGFVPNSGSDQLIDLRASGQWELIVASAVSTLVPLSVAGLLIGYHSKFPVRVAPGRVRLGAAALLAAVLAVSGAYLLMGVVAPDGFSPAVSSSMLLDDLPERFVPVGFLSEQVIEFVPTAPGTRLIYFWMGPMVWLVLAAVTFWLLWAQPLGQGSAAALRYRQLRHAGGGGSLGHMGLWPSMLHWTSASGDAAIAYVLVGGFALAVSDPVCAESRRMSAIRDFAEHCDATGNTAVFYAVHDPVLPIFAQLGWTSIRVGEEAVLDPAAWSMVGKDWQDVRSSINRARRAGLHAVWTSWAELTLSQRTQIRSISEEWVAAHGLPQMGFTLGGLAELADEETRLMLAVGSDGRIEAVTSWMPSWRAAESEPQIDGWTLDVMRRRAGSMNGVMEFLIAGVVERAAADGVRFVSLSTAPLGGTGGIQGLIARTLEPVYGFGSLLRFKSKFRPHFETISVAFPDPLALPAIGTAIVRAYLPGVTVRQGMSAMRSLARSD